jgi:hypothetical protein
MGSEFHCCSMFTARKDVAYLSSRSDNRGASLACLGVPTAGNIVRFARNTPQPVFNQVRVPGEAYRAGNASRDTVLRLLLAPLRRARTTAAAGLQAGQNRASGQALLNGIRHSVQVCWRSFRSTAQRQERIGSIVTASFRYQREYLGTS